jgi:hypothetical protein
VVLHCQRGEARRQARMHEQRASSVFARAHLTLSHRIELRRASRGIVPLDALLRAERQQRAVEELAAAVGVQALHLALELCLRLLDDADDCSSRLVLGAQARRPAVSGVRT